MSIRCITRFGLLGQAGFEGFGFKSGMRQSPKPSTVHPKPKNL